MFDVCTTGDTAHIDTILKSLPHKRQDGCIDIDAPMLTRVWQELEYRIDVCLVTRGTHIEYL
jgi:16S rRNA C1402 N4-methylase RsmH